METPSKICSGCSIEFLATKDNFYRHPASKYGLTPKCKSCVNIQNKESHAKRLLANPSLIKEQANNRTKAFYQRNKEKLQEKHRLAKRKKSVLLKETGKWDNYLNEKRAAKYGMSVEQLESLFKSQNNSCAICECTEPPGNTKWNIDHCHSSSKVRFILCCHCNRGLGAFKDKPEFMRKAANLLEGFSNDSK